MVRHGEVMTDHRLVGPPLSPAGAQAARAPRPLLHNAVFATASSGSSVLLLALLIVAARTLGDQAYGRFSFALALAVIFETLMDFGLKEVTTRAIAREPRHATPYLQNTFGLKLALGAGALVALTVTAAVLRPEPDIRWAAVLLGVAAVLRSYMTTIRSVFYGVDRFDLETVVLVSDRLLVLTFGAAALLLGYGLIGLAMAFMAARAAAFLLATGLTARTVGRPMPAFDLGFWRDLQLRAIPFGAFVVVLQLYNYLDIVMLGVMRGDSETGLYSAAYRVYEGFSNIPSIISVVLTPRLAREFISNRASHHRTAFRGVWVAAVLGIPVALGAIVAAPYLTQLLFGAAFAPSAMVLQILAAGFVVVFPLAVLHAVAISTNAERLLLVTGILGLVVNSAANLVLIPTHGMHGAAIATIIGEAASLCVLGAGLWRRDGAAQPPPLRPPDV
jgi:O-antigen/teichoic acid export membrane protein